MNKDDQSNPNFQLFAFPKPERAIEPAKPVASAATGVPIEEKDQTINMMTSMLQSSITRINVYKKTLENVTGELESITQEAHLLNVCVSNRDKTVARLKSQNQGVFRRLLGWFFVGTTQR